ncbi:MAG: ABC transporter ATP-binding protein [Planctomycetaceae bacterium]|nr:ABC transporter ATP-binding protein [Planctomycetaceae bacterium]
MTNRFALDAASEHPAAEKQTGPEGTVEPEHAPVIQMIGVTKRFSGKTVLDQLNFDLKPGSVTGLLGRNGSGKTTLLKCALGLQSPQAGLIRLMGENVATLSGTAKARLGYVPQEITLYSWMKIRQIIDYTRAFYPRWNNSLTEKLLTEWKLDREAKVGTLSTGQTQSLSILLALGHEPDLLVLDEPVASLDPSARRQFLATLLDVAMSGERTILFSTHITSDLERVADRVAVLRDGGIIYHDELSNLKDEVKRLRITTSGSLPDDLKLLPGLLSCESNGQSAVLSLRGFTPDLLSRFSRQWKAQIDVEDLNLEEIFLELHHE